MPGSVPNTPLKYDEWNGPDRGTHKALLLPALIVSGIISVALITIIVLWLV